MFNRTRSQVALAGFIFYELASFRFKTKSYIFNMAIKKSMCYGCCSVLLERTAGARKNFEVLEVVDSEQADTNWQTRE